VGCSKLVNGYNYREIQPTNNRPMYMYAYKKVCPEALPVDPRAKSPLHSVTEEPKALTLQQYDLLSDLDILTTNVDLCDGAGGLQASSMLLLLVLLAALVLL
jgi:hypothetical protein